VGKTKVEDHGGLPVVILVGRLSLARSLEEGKRGRGEGGMRERKNKKEINISRNA